MAPAGRARRSATASCRADDRDERLQRVEQLLAQRVVARQTLERAHQPRETAAGAACARAIDEVAGDGSSIAASSNSIGASASARIDCGAAPSSPNESMSARAGNARTSQRAMSQPKLIVTGVHAMPLFASFAREPGRSRPDRCGARRARPASTRSARRRAARAFPGRRAGTAGNRGTRRGRRIRDARAAHAASAADLRGRVLGAEAQRAGPQGRDRVEFEVTGRHAATRETARRAARRSPLVEPASSGSLASLGADLRSRHDTRHFADGGRRRLRRLRLRGPV